MTASKSNRARNARSQANAARNGGAAGRANGNGTATKASPVKASPVKASPVKATPVKAGSVKAGTMVKASTSATRGGVPDRRGPRGSVTADVAVEAPETGTVPLWLQLTTWVLSLAGLGVSIYLTIAHFTESALLGCAESGTINCTKVTTSPQSYVFGIPVAVLGLAFFVGAVALMSPWAWRAPKYRREISILRIASLVVGMGFVLYLVYAELFIIDAICLYCTSVHAITFLLFLLTAISAAVWGLPSRQRDAV
jgi:uncharacterized membrane protein